MFDQWRVVTTQAELDSAIESRCSHISLVAPISVDVRLPLGGPIPVITAITGSILRVGRGSPHVEARKSSQPHVVAWGSSQPHVVAWESSQPHVEAWGSSQPHVVARESSQPHVEAWGSSQPHVEARESSQPHVEARGYVGLRLSGVVSATATAGCSVHLHDGAKCDGGVQIRVERPQTPREWCDWYGAKIDGEDAILFKGVDAAFVSMRSAVYQPGTETQADDWDRMKRECGGGLHFSPTPAATLQFNPKAVKFVACRVPLAEIAVHPNGEYPNKVKARACWNWYECDRFGKQIGERFERQNERSD